MTCTDSSATKTNLRSTLVLAFLCGLTFSLQAQEKVVARPNIPGSFIVDFGVNRILNKPDTLKYGIFGSRTVNLYYQYPIRFGRSKFSFNPGIGFSLERFKITNGRVLADTVETGAQREGYELVPSSRYFTAARKIMLVTNYLEVPLEFRFDTKPEDMARSFNVSLGARIGYLIDSQQKIKYKENDQIKRNKDKQDFGMTALRYGASLRIGIGGFNVFGFYNLTPMFQKDKGPQQTEMNSFTVGISINGF